MRVLHVYRVYFPDPPGGLQEAIRQICLATQAQGVENTIFTLSPQCESTVIIRPEAKVVRCRSWAAPSSCDLGGMTALRVFAKLASGVDVIHYHFPWPFADLLHMVVRPKIPTVMTYHSDIVRQRWLARAYAPAMRRMLSAMSAVVATSPAYVRTSPILSASALNVRLRVIPLGIDESSYLKDSDSEILQRLGLLEGAPFFLFIGVLRYYKGLHMLVHAAATIGCKVVIAGSGPEGESLRVQASARNASNIMFTGQISDGEKASLLKACRALVLPSHLRSEAFGMVLVEAAMVAKPMISCEIGTGTSFVNVHEKTGFVVPPEDPTALADAMNRLLNDSGLARDYGLAARQRYEELFSGEYMGRAYADLYGSL